MTWKTHPPEERFFDKIEDACWVWIGGRKAAGYGQFSVDNKKVIAHRWAYERFVGPIPDGYEIDHLCHNRSCVNPRHLEAISVQENRRRRNARKTHCPQGHPYEKANTRMQGDSDGYFTRVCRICERARSREKNKKRSQK